MLEWEDVGVPNSLDRESEFFEFTCNYVSGRFRSEKWEFLNGLDISTWQVSQIANLALSLPFQRDSWEWVSNTSEKAADAYWSNVRCAYLHLSEEDAVFVIEQFVTRDRPFTAIEFLDFQNHKGTHIDTKTAIALLLVGLNSQESPSQHQRYSIERLIGLLQSQQDCDLNQLALIEWGYLPIFDSHSSSSEPKTLEAAVAREPEFFVMLLEAMYRDENLPPPSEPVTVAARAYAKRAKMLLENITTLPGSCPDGTIDYLKTAEWIAVVRPLAEAKGRSKRGDIEIGKLLFKAVKGRGRAPDSPLANILETLKSEAVLDGFAFALRQARGITSRSPFDGGKQEHELAAQYRGISATFAGTHPNLSDLYGRIALSYEADAKREDLEAERERLGR
jgi:hypothetical protein